ncbi:uncharacterized protein [Amphiura filiformis]|uniref:uncharacterized protein n=1 Tax=Amphiura filiformis TaxID=82378 RepID=UPI003B2175B2
MAAKQRNKRSKQQQDKNGTNSPSATQTSADKDGKHVKANPKVLTPNLLQNPFFLTGVVTVVISVMAILLYLNMSWKPSRMVVVTKVHDESNPDKQREYKRSLDTIDRRSNLSLEEYRELYDGKWPVLITDALPTMRAMNWTKKFFMEKYGNEIITIRATEDGLAGIKDTLAMPLGLFLSHLHEGQPKLWTYLMDELFLLQKPELQDDLDDILYLQDDFFQLFPREIRPWNSMLLWGTKFSRSHLHIDPYNWTGTNAVFSGLKKWKLFPPGQDYLLHVKKGSNSGFPLNCFKYSSDIDAFNPDLKRFPRFAKAKAIEFDQHPGELLLIPTGWFHQAYNDEETMAVSSQVMNINNYKIVLEEIFKAGNLKKKSLPANFDTLSPESQVKTVMRLLPKHILEKGRELTADALRQIDGVRNKQPG